MGGFAAAGEAVVPGPPAPAGRADAALGPRRRGPRCAAGRWARLGHARAVRALFVFIIIML